MSVPRKRKNRKQGGESEVPKQDWIDVDKYKGNRKFCEMMSELWRIINSAVVDADSLGKLDFITDTFLPWFEAWEASSRVRGLAALKARFPLKKKFSELDISHYFFTREGAMDLKGVAMSVPQLAKYVLAKYPTLTLYLHRLTSDVVEHDFGGYARVCWPAEDGLHEIARCWLDENTPKNVQDVLCTGR